MPAEGMTPVPSSSPFQTTAHTMLIAKKTCAPAALALALTLAFGNAHAQSAESQIAKRLDELTAEVTRLKAALLQIKEQQTAAVPAPTAAAPTMAAAATQLTSCGEIFYSRPRRDTSATQANVGRFVISFQHRADERTQVVAELEVEHAVTSATDSGEVAVEQLFVEYRINQNYVLRAGLFLIPIGLVNQNHEPTTY
jgi:hypothetical protein